MGSYLIKNDLISDDIRLKGLDVEEIINNVELKYQIMKCLLVDKYVTDERKNIMCDTLGDKMTLICRHVDRKNVSKRWDK